MEAPTVVFWLVMTLAGAKEPTRFQHAVEDLPACEFEARTFMRRPPHELLLRGGTLSAGCQVSFPTTSEDH